WHEVALNEHPTDRCVGIAVVGVVVDAQRRAVFEDHPCRALDLNCERLEGIPDPADFELLSIERACLDGAAIVVRHDLAVFVAAPDQRALVGKGAGTRRVAGGYKIMRTPVERHVKFRIGKARALDDRLVVAGQEPLRFAETADLYRPKIVLEEAARGPLVGRPRPGRAPADPPERPLDR